MGNDKVTRIGKHGPKQGGSVLRKHELRTRLQKQVDDTLDELAKAKVENHRLRGVLKALCLNNGGAIDIPLDYLEQYCQDAACSLAVSPRKGHIRAQVTSPTPAEAVTPHVEQAPAPPPTPRPVLLGPDGRPIGDMAPRVQVVEGGQRVLADGRIVQEHAGYRAEVVNEIPGLG